MSGVLCQQRGLLRKGVVGLERLPDHRHWVAAVGERPVRSVLVDDAPTLPLLQIEPLCDASARSGPGRGRRRRRRCVRCALESSPAPLSPTAPGSRTCDVPQAAATTPARMSLPIPVTDRPHSRHGRTGMPRMVARGRRSTAIVGGRGARRRPRTPRLVVRRRSREVREWR